MGAGLKLLQTDATFLCTKASFCSGNGLGASAERKSTHMEPPGIIFPGTTTQRCTVANGGGTLDYVWYSAAPGSLYDYAGGTWTVELQVQLVQASFSGKLMWNSIHICQLNSSCANQGTIASLTNIRLGLVSATKHSKTLTGASSPPTAWTSTDRIMVILGFSNTSPTARYFDWKNNAAVYCPFVQLQALDNPGMTEALTGQAVSNIDLTLPDKLRLRARSFIVVPDDIADGGAIEIDPDDNNVDLDGIGSGLPDDPPDPIQAPVPPGDGVPGTSNWLGGLWRKSTYPRYGALPPPSNDFPLPGSDGGDPPEPPREGGPKGYYIPRALRLWSLNKCGTLLWGLLVIAENTPVETDDDHPNGEADALEFMTQEWTEEDYGFDRPMTMHLVRATTKHVVLDRHQEWCSYHLGHMVVGRDGFDHLEFCYANDFTGDYMDPGYAHFQGLLPNEDENGDPVADEDIVNSGERTAFAIDPETDERYVETGQECFVSAMHHPEYHHGWVMDQAIYCGDPT